MSRNSHSAKKEKGTDKTAIYVAIIGLVGTLFVAIISIINSRMTIELPFAIELTKTALAQTSVAPPSQSNNSTINRSITSTPLPPPPISENQAAQWTLVFFDKFDTDSNGWSTGTTKTKWIESTKILEKGKYIWDLKLIGRPGFTSARPLLKTFTDFYLNVDIKHVSGSKSGAYGIQFRDYTGNSYIFQINSEQRFAIYYDLINGESKIITEWTETAVINPFSDNNLTLISQNSRFYFYINHQYVADVEVSNETAGELGLEASLFGLGDTGKFEFDNFEIRSP